MMQQACAPGKLILSGEHAVVYGHPALALAINRYVTTTITPELIPQILFDLTDVAHRGSVSMTTLKRLKERIKQHYQRFQQGDFSIREVIQQPFELTQFAFSLFLESLNKHIPHGMKIAVQSTIPVGCGMGSSAATILSVMVALSHYLDVSIADEKLFQLALEAEKMQHGFTSGLDVRIALNGGCLYMQGEKILSRALPPLPMYLVNTGMPQTTTGECVEKVAAHFKQTPQLGAEFAAVTNALDAAIKTQSSQQIQAAIRENHRLLMQIGVVPEKIKQFISEAETMGMAAKICGAGAVAGERAGVVWITTTNAMDEAQIAALAARFHYSFFAIQGVARGVHVVI